MQIIAAADHLLVQCYTAALYCIFGSLGVVTLWSWITRGRGL